MDLSEINAALKDISRPYADRRVNVFEVEPSGLDAGGLRLRGRVLEEAQRQALLEGLAQRFPELPVDAQEVAVARMQPSELLAVATNLTSMHDSPSFLAEMVTQMLNGVVVEVLWEQGNWCFARQPDGYLGWTYRPYLGPALVSSPTHLVIEPVGLLRDAPRSDAALVTRVLGGTAVCVSDLSDGWARLEMAGGPAGACSGNRSGDCRCWLPSVYLRALGDLPWEAGARRALLVEDAFRMIGVPYLWGGCSANGIDCSGFAQLLHRWIGITLPRDADMQYEAGQPVEPPFMPGDLLFFGEKGEQRRITHVTVSLGGWQVIHSSRRRNGVQVDDVQAVAGLRDSYLCAATYIGR